MQFICGLPAQDTLYATDLLATYEGRLAEQFVGQELMAYGGSQHNRLYYWMRAAKNSNAEVDYLLVRDGKIFPIEVKKGPEGHLKSLHLFLKEHPKIKKAYVLNSGNGGQNGSFCFRPIYTFLG